jgi:type IV secretion system protein VirB10
MDSNKEVDEDIKIPPLADKKRFLGSIIVGGIILILLGLSFFNKKKEENSEQEMQPLTMISDPVDVSITLPNEREIDRTWQTPEVVQEQKELPELPDLEALETRLAMQKEALAQRIHDRINAPIMVIDNSNNDRTPESSITASSSTNTRNRDPNMAFQADLAKKENITSQAEYIGPLNALILEGTLIHASLETAINSDLPGQLRAVVTYPVYAADGTQVLIPPASRVIAEYKSGIVQGQTRVFVIATRVITPEGISIPLNSGIASPLGVAGIGADTIDRYFIERFGQASLLALIGAGAANIGVGTEDQYNSASFYREEVASSFSAAANDALDNSLPRGPTLHINQGKPITLFVAADISFESVYADQLNNNHAMVFKQ